MARVFKIFADFYTGVLENIYNMLDSFDGLGGELFAKLKDAIGEILGKFNKDADAEEEE
ncbi:MAG: hypothetical protein IJU56_08985 [Clostridia bacterium]|nr:hypothetical protein [Clostridia bacterium]